ncbi:MAG TPA: metalloregulator ArsR/SmtB family transcription factor [Streptosporangiaceae bacterium]
MHEALFALADDTRRQIVETLAGGDRSAGELAALFSISRPGVSRHLRVLREAGLVSAEVDAQRRIYRLRPEPLEELDSWLARCRPFWEQRLDALDTEIARGQQEKEAR